jgi:hypothetical protein
MSQDQHSGDVDAARLADAIQEHGALFVFRGMTMAERRPFEQAIINALRTHSSTELENAVILHPNMLQQIIAKAVAEDRQARSSTGCDPDGALKEAEALLRPYLTSGAVFGVTPDHRFREIDQLPFRLVGDLSKLLQRSGAGVNVLRLQRLRDQIRKDMESMHGLNKPAALSIAEIIDECIRCAQPEDGNG